MKSLLRPILSENVTAGAASAKSSAAPAGTRAVMITARTNPVRVWFGSEPTASAASVAIPVDESRWFSVGTGEKVAVIREGASDGQANVVFLV